MTEYIMTEYIMTEYNMTEYNIMHALLVLAAELRPLRESHGGCVGRAME